MNWQHWTVAIFIYLAVLSTGAVYSKPISENETNIEDGCWVKGVRYKVNETWTGPVGECTSYTCYENDDYSSSGCPILLGPPKKPCFISDINYRVKWPDCCGQRVCPLEVHL